MREEFMRRRDVIVDGLNSIPGFSCVVPDGHSMPPEHHKTVRFKLYDHLLYNAGVACLSGTAFGASGEGYLKILLCKIQLKIFRH